MANMTKHMTFDVDRSPTIISALIHGRRVSGLDVAWLRREVFADGQISRKQADELFAVAASDAAKAPEWTAFFVEMITDYVVWQSRPTGAITKEQGDWLLKRVDEAATPEALAALANILGEAHRVPIWLAAAARERVKSGLQGVATGDRTAKAM
jgi:hypothetical protein